MRKIEFLIKTKNSYIFGAYLSSAWRTDGQYIVDPNAYIFSLINHENKPLKLAILSGDISYAGFCSTSFCPKFGDDFTIVSSNSNYANLGYSYKCPYTYGSDQCKNFLAGSYNFEVSEMELYQQA